MLSQEELDKLLEEGADSDGQEPSDSASAAQDASPQDQSATSEAEANDQSTQTDKPDESGADDQGADDIDWGDAFAEAASGGDSAAAKAMADGTLEEETAQAQAQPEETPKPKPKPQPKTDPPEFSEFQSSAATQQSMATTVERPNLDFIMDLPLNVSVELGRCKMPIRELLQLGQGAVVELNKMAGEPADIYVNQKLMAKGEVVVVNEKFGVRLTEIISPADRVKGLG